MKKQKNFISSENYNYNLVEIMLPEAKPAMLHGVCFFQAVALHNAEFLFSLQPGQQKIFV